MTSPIRRKPATFLDGAIDILIPRPSSSVIHKLERSDTPTPTTIPPLRRSKTIEIITNRRSPHRLQQSRHLSPSPIRRKQGYSNIDSRSPHPLGATSELFEFYEDSEESQAKVIEQYLLQRQPTVHLSNDNDENKNINIDIDKTKQQRQQRQQRQTLTVTQTRHALREINTIAESIAAGSDIKPRHRTDKQWTLGSLFFLFRKIVN